MGTKAYTNTQTDQLDMYVHTHYVVWPAKSKIKSDWVNPYIQMLNKNTLGVKKVRGQSEAALQTGATKNFDIS